ncbi:GlxA family transcriptional regulator [Rhodococcus tukisamuensis]|uniref:Transcriptional regulator GlxA family, contains an amidase domain and an AraC-type DNA-binding HTH domain n=1 Tax=Rhodococcus tukisamuensis TaxID=168276 RepID=A0A1G6RI41_9NOCA|nr:helix-turn-helix domain-containing protein [Rhodococcus tukisamuensis]SDD04319.1 Transcriptional regulator GlxA family, contains an amidase domain and an AraC-type DNA-binding HTH domain [Rhodococcus tukisamuensis]
MRIGILAYDGCFAAEVFLFSDMLRIANRVARQRGVPAADLFEVSVIGASDSPVAAAGGFPIGVRRWHHGFDLLVVPGFEFVPAEDTDARLAGWEREVDFLRAAAARRTRIASVCVGAFLLGQAGALDGRRSTTSWLYASQLGRRHPRTTVCVESLIVHDGHITTTAAFSASLDLATALVREHLGADVASITARVTLVSENRTSQAPYIVEAMVPAAGGPFADEVGRWLVEHLQEPYNLSRLAGEFHVSSRTLLRRFGAEAGRSPLAFLLEARVRAAKHLLAATDVPLGDIPRRIGYQDPGALRRLFVERVGVSAAEYRRQFRRPRPPR